MTVRLGPRTVMEHIPVYPHLHNILVYSPVDSRTMPDTGSALPSG